MDFHWAGYNRFENQNNRFRLTRLSSQSNGRVPDDSDAGSIELSPVLKRHNAYMVHNETIYCQEVETSFS